MTNNKQYMYLVAYSQGVWDDYVKIDVFVTHDESKAQTYVDKFNTLLDKWKSYFNEIVDMENAWLIAHVDGRTERAYQVWNVNRAYIDKIELR
jgi:ABC-type transporter Mla maintaining outer membrane lipid asymmetry ATPase subunit MlaF